MHAASSLRDSGTSMRVCAEQVWPLLRKQGITVPLMATGKSASARMPAADLPPSSSATRLTVAAATTEMRLPARVEQVNDTISTSGLPTSASPIFGPVPLTRLNTPGGKPAASMTSASTKAFNGATSDGFNTTVHPAANAAAGGAAGGGGGGGRGGGRAAAPTGAR